MTSHSSKKKTFIKSNFVQIMFVSLHLFNLLLLSTHRITLMQMCLICNTFYLAHTNIVQM